MPIHQRAQAQDKRFVMQGKTIVRLKDGVEVDFKAQEAVDDMGRDFAAVCVGKRVAFQHEGVFLFCRKQGLVQVGDGGLPQDGNFAAADKFRFPTRYTAQEPCFADLIDGTAFPLIDLLKNIWAALAYTGAAIFIK